MPLGRGSVSSSTRLGSSLSLILYAGDKHPSLYCQSVSDNAKTFNSQGTSSIVRLSKLLGIFC